MRQFTRIPKMVTFQRAGAPAYLIPVYCALSDYAANKTGLCWPRMDTLASTLNLSVRTVQRHLRSLRELGLIEFVERRRSARGRFSSWCYRLVLMPSFSKKTTGHRRQAARGPSNVSGTKRGRRPPLSPSENKEEQRRRRRAGGYGWLFGEDEAEEAR